MGGAVLIFATTFHDILHNEVQADFIAINNIQKFWNLTKQMQKIWK